MKGSWGVVSLSLLVLLLEAASIQSGFGFDLPSTSTVPAFLWSNFHHQDSYSGMKDSVDYRTISQKDLANVIVSEGGWSSLLCTGTKAQQPVDIGLVFVGRELQSSDIFRNEHVDQALMHSLKVSFSRANSSVAFPYISSSEENESMEGSLISGFTESCGHALGVSNVAYLESCSVHGEKFQKLADMQSVHDYLASVTKNKQKGQKDLVVICSADTEDHSWSEGEILSELISSVEKSGRSYSVLFASDPNRSVQPSYRTLDRFLAESTAGNASLNSSVFCDGVCQIKSSLLEGLLVAIVLIIILISGLCCMMGIDTPTRFEAPQDS